jgi:hypothetical protein
VQEKIQRQQHISTSTQKLASSERFDKKPICCSFKYTQNSTLLHAFLSPLLLPPNFPLFCIQNQDSELKVR